jgi:putative DNA primase/helicase
MNCIKPPEGVSDSAWSLLARPDGSNWLIDERNADGEVVGTAIRLPDGSKDFKRGGKRGLILAWPLDGYSGTSSDHPVYVCEGASDTAAMMTLGIDAVGIPMAGQCGAWLAQLLNDRHVVIVADADKAGANGTAKIVEALQGKAASIRVILPPNGAKDARTAVIAGADKAAFLSLAAESKPTKAASSVGATTGAGPLSVCMADVQTREVEWLWPGRIPLGRLTLISGEPDVGKSYLTAWLATRVSTGEAWPDGPSPEREPGGALFINAEDPADDTMVPRVLAQGGDTKRIRFIPLLDSDKCPWFSLADVSRLAATIQECEGCRLVVIDPVSSFLSGLDDSKNGDIRGLLGPLARLAQEARVAIVLINHIRKSGGSAINASMGSIAWVGACRAGWIVLRDPDDPSRRLFVPSKNNLAPDQTGLAYTIVGKPGRLQWADGSIDESTNSILARAAVLGGGGRAGAEEGDQRAREFLSARLAAGPVEGKIIIDAASKAGIGERALERACKTAGVIKRPGGYQRPSQWEMPGMGSPFTTGS